jgi:hypothetical protein
MGDVYRDVNHDTEISGFYGIALEKFFMLKSDYIGGL